MLLLAQLKPNKLSFLKISREVYIKGQANTGITFLSFYMRRSLIWPEWKPKNNKMSITSIQLRNKINLY